MLAVAVIQLALPDPPVSPFTSVAPLVFVIVRKHPDWATERSQY